MQETQQQNGLKVVRFDSWNAFTSSIPDLVVDDSIFRGQRDPSWKLQSHWERDIGWIRGHLGPGAPVRSAFLPNAYEANRDRYMHHFRVHAKHILQITDGVEITEGGWWAIGRHYGLISPLLDWTRNPLIAAFFAYIDFATWLLDGEPDNHELKRRKSTAPYCSVWRFRNARSVRRDSAFDLVTDDLPGITARQKAQEGVFTRVLDGRAFDLESYLDSTSCLYLLSRCDLPTNDVGQALAQLHDEGTHYGTMFPDLWGAVMYANTRRFVKAEALGEIMNSQ